MSENTDAQVLEKLQESFFSQAWEKLFDYGMETMERMDDYKTNLEIMGTNLKSLTAKASDINEQIINGELSFKRKRKREVDNWLKEVENIENELVGLQNEVQEQGFSNQFFGNEDRMGKLNGRINELVEESGHFGELLFDTCATRGKSLNTTGIRGKTFEKNVEKIWKWLVIDKVPNIGILGIGGVGKTTLAKHITNQLLEETQYSVYWVSVSQVFTINKLQSDIAKVIGLDLSGEENEDKRAGRLNQALSQKKDFVLILDNVQSEIDLEKMGDPLGVEGGRLIVTTRLLSVCRRIDCRETITVETLRTDESWTLFRETLGGRMAITSEVEEIAKCLAKECHGLPLGIILLAKIMKGVTDIHEWRYVCDEICASPMNQGDMEENVFQVIQFSFNRLDPKLQLCFLHCSLYPENYLIDKDKLIRNFISEELVDKRSFEKQLDRGNTMLSKLVNLCLLEPIFHDGEGFSTLRMHDLVRDMALSIARESPKYKVFAGLELNELPIEEEWTEDVDKISLMSNEIEKIPPEMAPNCPKLATMLLNENPLKSIPESFFAQMSGLRILDLNDTSIQELPNSLSDLESLNTLLLCRCYFLASVPYLGKLKSLRELDLSWTAIKEMPKGIENLINLQILMFKGANNLKLLPEDFSLISRLLECLELPFNFSAPVDEIVKFKRMKRFIGRFKDFPDFIWFQSQTGRLIKSFDYVVGSVEDYYIDEYEASLDSSKLRMHTRNLRSREGEDGVITQQKIIKNLEIENCDGVSSYLLDYFKSCPSSAQLLKISDCEGIESILNINHVQLMAEREIKVKSIWLNGLPDLKGLVNWEVGGGLIPCPPPTTLFISLQNLSISNCNKMKTLGLPFTCLHNIEVIEVGRCAEIEELIELVEVVDEEEILGVTITLPKLKSLTLSDLPNLRSICKATIDCKSIQWIEIDECPRLKRLPLSLPSCPSSDK